MISVRVTPWIESATRASQEVSASWKTFCVSIRIRRMRRSLWPEAVAATSAERTMPSRRTERRKLRG